MRIVGLCGCKIVEVRMREGCCRMHVLSVMKNMGAFKYVGVGVLENMGMRGIGVRVCGCEGCWSMWL